MDFLKKIFSFLMSVVMFLLFGYTSNFDKDKFVEAVNAKDIAALESMMCKPIKDKYKNLPELLAEFCDIVEEITDGGLNDYYFGSSGNSASNVNGAYSITGYYFEFGRIPDVPYSGYRISFSFQSQSGKSGKYSGAGELGIRGLSISWSDGSGEIEFPFSISVPRK